MLLFTFLLSLLNISSQVLLADTFVVVKEIKIHGNDKTKETIILRELDFTFGDTLDIRGLNERLDLNRRKIMNTNLFVNVEVKSQYETENQLSIHIHLQEQWFILGYPLFVLADRNFSEWWSRGHDFKRTIYGVDLIHSNFNGHGERMSIHLESGFTQRLDFSYRIPYIDKAQKTGIGMSVSYTTNKNVAFMSLHDTLYYLRSKTDKMRERFTGSIFLKKRYGFYDFHTLELRYNNIFISDTIRKLNPNYLENGNNRQVYGQLSYYFNYDFRDHIAYPLKGKRYELMINKLGVLPSDDIHQFEIIGDYSLYRPISKKVFYGLNIEAKISFPEHQAFYNIRGLGYGSDLVRGFELYVVDGNKYFYAKNTLKYELLKEKIKLNFIKLKQFNQIPISLYPNVFADYGYVGNRYSEENKSRLSNRSMYSFGMGLDVVTYYNLVIRFNYAFNSLNEKHFIFNMAREF
jgi:outer membrane protein assembly factor BamA